MGRVMNESGNIERLASLQGSSPAELQGTGATGILWRFSDAVDKRMASATARLFARDGVFRRGSETITGRVDIESFYSSRMADPERVTRHLWSNVNCLPSADSDACLQAVLTTYAFEPEISRTHLQLRIGNVVCRCVRDADEGWVFAEHAYERLFVAYLPLSPLNSSTLGVSQP
jgi:hypothetical protein